MALEPISPVSAAAIVEEEREVQRTLDEAAAERRILREEDLAAQEARRIVREDELVAASESKIQRDGELVAATQRMEQDAEILSAELQRAATLTAGEVEEDLAEYNRTSAQQTSAAPLSNIIDEEA